MATKKTKSAKAANETTSTRKGATKHQVVETIECADLEMFTIDTEMQTGESRRGTLMKRGKYNFKFEQEGVKIKRNTRPWECRIKLAETKPYARISANSNGAFLHVYAPKENFRTNQELIETFLDETELLCEKMEGIDAIAIIDKLEALKQELLEDAA